MAAVQYLITILLLYCLPCLPPCLRFPLRPRRSPRLASRPAAQRPSSGVGRVGRSLARDVMFASNRIVKQKDIMISELRETNTILDAKARKLEQLVRLKDAKIQTLLNKLQALGALRGE